MEEETFNPKWVSRPSNTIKDILETKKISLKEFQKLLEMSDIIFINFMNDEIAISTSLAFKLSEILGGTINFWIKRYNMFFEGKAQNKKIV